MIKTKYERGLIFILILMTVFAGLFFLENHKYNRKIKEDLKQLNLLKTEREGKVKLLQKELGKLDLKAKSVSVYDGTLDQNIFSKNENKIMPLASLAKIMTVLVALNANDSIDVTISKEAIEAVGDFGLVLNEKWNIKDLAKLALVSSANDAAIALSERNINFVTEMNNFAKKMEMKKFLFLNTTGLDIDINKAGAYGSAYEINKLALYSLRKYPEVFKATSLSEINLKSKSNIIHTVKNTNIIVDKIPDLLFSKTGFTNIAGGNLTIILRDKDRHRIAITLLGSTFSDRFSDMEKIIDILYKKEK